MNRPIAAADRLRFHRSIQLETIPPLERVLNRSHIKGGIVVFPCGLTDVIASFAMPRVSRRERDSRQFSSQGTAKTLSMEASPAPATPSPAAPLSSQVRMPVSRSSATPAPHTHAHRGTPVGEFESSGTSRAPPPVPVSQWMVTFTVETFQTMRRKYLIACRRNPHAPARPILTA